MPDFLGLHEVRQQADRGFCDTDLISWLHVCRWHYRIRIKSSLILAAPDGQRLCKVSEIRLAARETRCFHNVTVTAQHFGLVHLALGRPIDSAEQSKRLPSTVNVSRSRRASWTVRAASLPWSRPEFGMQLGWSG